MPRKVPDRWMDYTAVGERVAGTRFISFKVPLHQGLSTMLEESERLTPRDLVAKIKTMGHDLGLIVDLTNTSRYYNYKEIEDLGICYHKIHTEGHVVPSKAVRKNFFATVDEFLRNNVDNDLLVGVHCTHGVNRTGYLVCKYMITRLNFQAKEAIAAFNMARGHPLERSNYIADLWNSTPGNSTGADGDAKLSSPPTNQETGARSRDRAVRGTRRQRGDYQPSRGRYGHHSTHSPEQEKPWRNTLQTHPWGSSYHHPFDQSPQYQLPWQPMDYPQWQPSPWQLPSNGYTSGGGGGAGQQGFFNRQNPGGAANGEQADFGAGYYEYPTYYGGGYPGQ